MTQTTINRIAEMFKETINSNMTGYFTEKDIQELGKNIINMFKSMYPHIDVDKFKEMTTEPPQ